MARDLSAAVALITKFEGLRLAAYIDPVGVPTIGWGTTKYPNGSFVKMGDKISDADAKAFFEHDLQSFAAVVESAIKVACSDNTFCALVSFAYNVGAGAFKSSTLLKKLNAGDFDGAKNEFARWNKGGGKVLNGLIRRRAEEAALFGSMPDKPAEEIETPSWFEPFKKLILQILEKLFGTTTAPVADDADEPMHGKILRQASGMDARALTMALPWVNNAMITNKKVMLLVDFNKPDSAARMHMIDMVSGASKAYKVAHGKNSDPDKDGMATDFSNVSGSFKSSLGPVLIGKSFHNPKWKYVRLLYGLMPGSNDKIRSREILLHSTTYVNDVPGQPVGDTLGCFGMSEATAKVLFPQVEGALLFAWDDTLKA